METRRKSDLVKQFEKRMKEAEVEVTNKEATLMVNEVIESMIDLIYGSEKFEIQGFMSWEKVRKEARQARNPKTGETIQVPAKTVVKEKLSKKIKELQ